MAVTLEMEEIAAFVASKKDFVFFDSFADYLISGIEPDLDIDFLCSSPKSVDFAKQYLLSFNWKHIQTDKGTNFVVVDLKKNSTSCKLLFSKSACKVLFKESKLVSFKKYKVPCLNAEALFLSTLNQISAADRPSYKIQKDRESLCYLRKKINVPHFKKLVSKTHDEFWSHSYL